MSEFSLRALAREVWDDLGGCGNPKSSVSGQRRTDAHRPGAADGT